jgi:SAM-dependent methyltransferase
MDQIYAKVSPLFRRRRMRQFLLRMKPTPETTILDVGGGPATWENTEIDSKITILNIYPIPLDSTRTERQLETVVGDGCHLEYNDGAFDIVFSNSVIEHVGTFERQKAFAKEVRRVGKALWIQTPARSFFIEPHLLAPFIHFFPRPVQERLARHFSVWGMLTKPTPQEVEDFLREIRLLNKPEMNQLFPDCEIIHERLLGLTKSFIAVRGFDVRKSQLTTKENVN